jgi:hypothetical protein
LVGVFDMSFPLSEKREALTCDYGPITALGRGERSGIEHDAACDVQAAPRP